MKIEMGEKTTLHFGLLQPFPKIQKEKKKC